ncbi:MAG: hypothetical protein Q9182_003159 [Xanthomendoza sp. 2 TL-2023]
MCGIWFSYGPDTDVSPSTDVFDCLQRRGPDHTKGISVRQFSRSFYFFSSVLSLRGDSVVRQPLEDPVSGSILCWNGEGWKYDDNVILGNDTEAVFDILLKATADEYKADEAIVNALHRISGPYAFVFHDAKHRKVFYGRDPLGRRSLLTRKGQDGSFTISSVSSSSSSDTWTEVEANGIYMTSYSGNSSADFDIVEEHIAWPVPNDKSKAVSIDPQTVLLLLTDRFIQLSFPKENLPLQCSEVPRLTLTSPAVHTLLENLRYSLAARIVNVPAPPSNTTLCARIAILFSGGLDCTLVARVAHDLLPEEQEIDLLNVAFENPRVLKAACAANDLTGDAYSLCPDRLTGISSYAELQRVCPGRKWRFVSINVPYSETTSHRPQIISLIHPHRTEMDLSIACALYFAARGSGTIHSSLSEPCLPYTTPARVLLSGLGADEVFAGYNRHAIAFARAGYQGLANELELDYQRLGKRNLGRDDRVISHWAREVRYPYLDEDFLRWALQLPLWEKCGFGNLSPDLTASSDFSNDLALGPSKLLLRLLAWRLDMKFAAAEKKRAIQFGARTAKMEAGRTKGTELLS